MEVVNYDRRTRVTTVDIIIREGKNRQIRRMFEGIGHDVKSITRVSHGPIRIKNLRPGEWRELEQVSTCSIALAHTVCACEGKYVGIGESTNC